MLTRFLFAVVLVVFALATLPARAEFVEYNKEKRTRIVDELFQAIRRDYALLPLKENNRNFNLNLEAMRKQAFVTEQAVPDDVDDEKQASTNLEFIDRVRAIAARFKDSHFSVRPLNPLQPVTLGVYVKKINNVFYMSAVSQKIMAYNDNLRGGKDFSAISPGDILLGFGECPDFPDGCPPEGETQKLRPYISASSDAFSEEMATYYLSERDFFFPKENYVQITVKHKESGLVRSYKLPWYLSSSSSRGDQALVLQKSGMNRELPFMLTWDPVSKTFTPSGLETIGYSLQQSFSDDLVSEKTYKDVSDPETPALRIGFGFRDGAGFALLQLFNFAGPTIFESGQPNPQAVDLVQTVATFLQSVKAKKVPLLLDLRCNGGGDILMPPKIFSMLIPAASSYPGMTMSFRVNDYTRELFPAIMGLGKAHPQLSNEMDAESFSKLLQNAIAKKQDFTDAISLGAIRPDEKGGGFDNKIVVLIGPRCASACEMFVELMRSSKRGILIGQPTNGTGAGFYTAPQYNTEWRDTSHVFMGTIPNFLFGRPGPEIGKKVFAGTPELLNSENKPVAPDIEYAGSERDLLNKDQELLDLAITELRKP